MRSLLAKILVAQFITVILALLVVMLITRVSLSRGFIGYLEQQETAVLGNLAPALANLYETRGDWSFLQGKPRNWERILRQTAPRGAGSAGDDERRLRPGSPGRGRPAQTWDLPEGHLLHFLRTMDRLRVRQRLFLLDNNRSHIAGAAGFGSDTAHLEKIVVNREVVGWIGFKPMDDLMPAEARRFLRGQVRIMAISLVVALLLAALPAFLLARHMSRPVRQLDKTVGRLTDGDYLARAMVASRDEIGRLARNVNQLAETLEMNRTARQRWMADIAHELRTPVAILKGEIEAVADGVRLADERTAASLGEEINQLSALVDDLQALALSDAGALNIRKETVEMSELVRHSGDSYRVRLAEREIRLEMHLEENVLLIGDAQRLRQLLHNLLENSCRYVHAGGRVRLLLTKDEAEAELLLEDSGPGVDPEQLDKLFDRFYRVEGSRSRATGGTGLGLAICKNIVKAHGGRIEADQSPLGGLRIRIFLPAKKM